MKIAISAESTIDLPQNLLDQFGITTTPFSITFGDKLEKDRLGISKDIFSFVEKTKKLPKTSAVSPEQFKEYFEELKKDHDAIIHISLSSLMSSAYNNAVLVAKEMENVYVIDSRTLSTGIALQAIKAKELANAGKTPTEIVETINAITAKTQASFVLEKLNYLYKGGRCSALALLGANILRIKPQIVVSNGKMGVGKKYTGEINKVAIKYCKDLLVAHPEPVLDYVFITSSTDMPEAENAIIEILKERGFDHIYPTRAGGTISSHCGENCIGVLFLDK